MCAEKKYARRMMARPWRQGGLVLQGKKDFKSVSRREQDQSGQMGQSCQYFPEFMYGVLQHLDLLLQPFEIVGVQFPGSMCG